MAAFLRVEQDLVGFLDAFEEGVVVLLAAGAGGLLVRVVAEDLLTVGALDLVLGGAEAVLGEAEDFVVVLVLFKSSACRFNTS